MVIIEKSDDKHDVYHNGELIGTVMLFHNPHHMNNCYVRLEMNRLDTELSAELFGMLKEIAGCQLQVMVKSDNVKMTSFLTAGGFVCKRKCYEAEVRITDYAGEIKKAPLCRSTAGKPEYEQSCRQMYEYYEASHEKINPLTADFKTFYKKLPQTGLYEKSETEIIHAAFVAGNEIAYVCSRDSEHFKEFAQCLVTLMLSQYETICFESDNCDWAAMELRGLFQNSDETSYDTYVYGSKA